MFIKTLILKKNSPQSLNRLFFCIIRAKILAKELKLLQVKQNVIIAGVSHLQENFDYSMEELAKLAASDNLNVVTQVRQNLDHINNQLYFGNGKVYEIKHLARYYNLQLVIINDELSPAQIRNLEKKTQLHFLDRTELILQIFAKRAHSRKAQLQVAIAQLQYQLPRIHPSGNPLDQQRGNGGLTNRGVGESQLELNRRTIRQQISKMQQNLRHVQQTLDIQSNRRQGAHFPQVALVGYTNAGKSTTMNGLLSLANGPVTKKVLVKNQLFATLETSIRKVSLPRMPDFLISDTVGFISKLPHNLIEPFRSTLSEAQKADLLIQVVDASSSKLPQMLSTTQKALTAIGINKKPMIYAYNKADQTTNFLKPEIIGNSIYYSALQQSSLKTLINLIYEHLFKDYRVIKVFIPFANTQLNHYVHQFTIQRQEYTFAGTIYQLFVSPQQSLNLQKYKLN